MVKYRILFFMIGIYCICSVLGMHKGLFTEISTTRSRQRDVFYSINRYFNLVEKQESRQEYNIEKFNNEDIAFFLYYFNLYAKRNNKEMISFLDYNCEKDTKLLKKLSLFSLVEPSKFISETFLSKICLFLSSYNYFFLDQDRGDFPKNEQEEKVLLDARIDMEFLRIIMGIGLLESGSEKAKMSGESSEDENDNNQLSKNNSEEWQKVLGEKILDEIISNSSEVKTYFKNIFRMETYAEILPQSSDLFLYEKMFSQSSSFSVKESNIYNQKNIDSVVLEKPLVIENALNSESDYEEASCKGKPKNNLGSCQNGFHNAMDSFREEINTIINPEMK